MKSEVNVCELLQIVGSRIKTDYMTDELELEKLWYENCIKDLAAMIWLDPDDYSIWRNI